MYLTVSRSDNDDKIKIGYETCAGIINFSVISLISLI